VIVDIELDSNRPTERLAYFDPASNPGSTVLVHKQPDNVWRIDYQLRDGEDAEQAVKPENVIPRVQSLLDMMGEHGAWAPIWITIYKANALTLRRYRHGRVLFAGDAAHLVPIFGVRGANSGIDDADNVAWKLAYVIREFASDKLLDSYSDERVFATHENLSYGTKSTEFMAPPSFAFDLMRKAVLGLAVKHSSLRSLINPRQTSAITYSASSLNVADATPDAFAAGPVPGAILPECPVTIMRDGHATEAHLTDALHPGFTAFYFSDNGTIPSSFENFAPAVNGNALPFALVPISSRLNDEARDRYGWDHTGQLFTLYDAKVGTVYLIRPDGHVLARWQSATVAQIAAAIDHALS
jgi:3-(3-hydroxy-phenyl)propionate hydroxylase